MTDSLVNFLRLESLIFGSTTLRAKIAVIKNSYNVICAKQHLAAVFSECSSLKWHPRNLCQPLNLHPIYASLKPHSTNLISFLCTEATLNQLVNVTLNSTKIIQCKVTHTKSSDFYHFIDNTTQFKSQKSHTITLYTNHPKIAQFLNYHDPCVISSGHDSFQGVIADYHESSSINPQHPFKYCVSFKIIPSQT